MFEVFGFYFKCVIPNLSRIIFPAKKIEHIPEKILWVSNVDLKAYMGKNLDLICSYFSLRNAR